MGPILEITSQYSRSPPVQELTETMVVMVDGTTGSGSTCSPTQLSRLYTTPSLPVLAALVIAR